MRYREPLVKTICFKGQKGDKGDKGDTGETGVSVSNIAKTSTSGNVDTYTITMTDGTTYTFTVRNGEHKQAYISQAAYDALVDAGTVDPECYYYIIDDHTGEEIAAAIAGLENEISVPAYLYHWPHQRQIDPGFYLVVLICNEGIPVKTQKITGSIFLEKISAANYDGLTYSSPFFWTSINLQRKMTLRLKAVFDHETEKYYLSVVDENGNNPDSQIGNFSFSAYIKKVFRTIGG